MPNTPLTDGINALTSYANSMTGEQDENLSDAVRTLADGYDDGSKAAGLIDGTFTGNYRNDAPMSGIVRQRFLNTVSMTGIELPNCTGVVDQYAFDGCTNLAKAILPNVTRLGQYAFNNCVNLAEIDIRNVEGIGAWMFRANNAYKSKVVFLKPLTTQGRMAIRARAMYICQRPVSFASDTWVGSTIDDMYVPWSEGEYPVPSGTNVHYNTVFDSEGNIISST